MRLSQRFRSAIGTLFAFCLTAAPGVEIYIAPLPAESGEFEPIWVELELRNKLAEPTIVDLGAKRKEHVLISVSTDRGEIRSVPVDLTGFGPPPKVEIQPLSIFRLRLLLNERFPHLPPGVYSVGSQFDGQAERDFTVNVLPVDTGKLAATCLNLSKRIENMADAEDAADAAAALSYIAHPVAVPCIAALLTRNNGVVPTLMKGLTLSTLLPFPGYDSGAERTESITNGVLGWSRSRSHCFMA